MNGPRCLVLLSGGLDSATVAAMMAAEGYSLCGLAFDYGQRHRVELERAQVLADTMGFFDFRIAKIDLGTFGGSALTDPSLDVPKAGSASDSIPITYVPARNTVFLAFALALAEVLEVEHIAIGVNAVDYSGYPDCRPEFIEAFQKVANLATRAGVEGSGVTIHTPLIHLTKRAIIERGLELGVDYSLTSSCYDPLPDGFGCGQCDSCRIRGEAFSSLGRRDPALQST